nr:ATP-binding cassette domain-containing protein [Capnocytophaga canimorsus]
MDIYRRCIALTDWKSHHESEEADFITKSLELLEDIGKFSVTVADRSLPVLEAKGIAKSYGVGKFYLSPISISIKKGEIYGLVGENGNGKTTLLRILAKDLSHNVGNLKYHFNSKPKDAYDLRTKLVYIPQRTEKWYGSLLDNLRFCAF